MYVHILTHTYIHTYTGTATNVMYICTYRHIHTHVWGDSSVSYCSYICFHVAEQGYDVFHINIHVKFYTYLFSVVSVLPTPCSFSLFISSLPFSFPLIRKKIPVSILPLLPYSWHVACRNILDQTSFSKCIYKYLMLTRASLVAQMVKRLSEMQETQSILNYVYHYI